MEKAFRGEPQPVIGGGVGLQDLAVKAEQVDGIIDVFHQFGKARFLLGLLQVVQHGVEGVGKLPNLQVGPAHIGK